jgi:chromosome segregation ATPase
MTDEPRDLVLRQLGEMRAAIDAMRTAMERRFDAMDERMNGLAADVAILKTNVMEVRSKLEVQHDQLTAITIRLAVHTQSIDDLAKILPRLERAP